MAASQQVTKKILRTVKMVDAHSQIQTALNNHSWQ